MIAALAIAAVPAVAPEPPAHPSQYVSDFLIDRQASNVVVDRSNETEFVAEIAAPPAATN